MLDLHDDAVLLLQHVVTHTVLLWVVLLLVVRQ